LCEIHDCDIRHGELRHAVLDRVSLKGSRMDGVDVSGAAFLGCRDLHEAVGLESVRGEDSCAFDTITLQCCVPRLPDAFLRTAGFSDRDLHALRGLFGHDA
jgi:uncharacterized protein YjbI with pentapeptide repeats